MSEVGEVLNEIEEVGQAQLKGVQMAAAACYMFKPVPEMVACSW